MQNKTSKNFMISILLVVAIICFTLGVFAVSEKNFSNTALPGETGSASAGQQMILNMNSTICIPDAIVGSRENNTNSNATEIIKFSRHYHYKQSIIFTLLVLFMYTSALRFCRFRYSISKTAKADMPVLALSLGGNSPPVIRA